MKITINLTKQELDTIEEALLQYNNLLLKSENKDEMVGYELSLIRRVLEEFGMEELDQEVKSQSKNLPVPPQVNQYPSSQQQYSAPNQYPSPGPSYPTPGQYPFSR
ncbi:hypothetical protein [Hazenella coriacea]|uniref:Uncharacterized protein n=1 Tax=Hazenella coriacea TaxID=1179467 RepID=A0A4V2UV92_9BACL|nr:hypothetical protein [Hazenella coriacea]TCS94887.1 hypothetical protein EDD58_103310 [Hazenella coriacea]